MGLEALLYTLAGAYLALAPWAVYLILHDKE